jgi:hypothetical protein
MLTHKNINQAKDGKFSKPGFLEMAKLWSGNDAELMPIAEDLGDECEKIVGSVEDRCDLGPKVEECILKGMIERKVDISMF